MNKPLGPRAERPIASIWSERTASCPAFPSPKVPLPICAPSRRIRLSASIVKSPPSPVENVSTNKPLGKPSAVVPIASTWAARTASCPAFPFPNVLADIRAPSAINSRPVSMIEFPPLPVAVGSTRLNRIVGNSAFPSLSVSSNDSVARTVKVPPSTSPRVFDTTTEESVKKIFRPASCT